MGPPFTDEEAEVQVGDSSRARTNPAILPVEILSEVRGRPETFEIQCALWSLKDIWFLDSGPHTLRQREGGRRLRGDFSYPPTLFSTQVTSS